MSHCVAWASTVGDCCECASQVLAGAPDTLQMRNLQNSDTFRASEILKRNRVVEEIVKLIPRTGTEEDRPMCYVEEIGMGA